ncbi:hypothetical protein LZC95_41575 [Pendulispora brunnea]|uniref:3-oxoacyl-ACP synthase n=1 Tax=Pendulispora brunnea TaxID=2905690 RepID=A0ABZ2K2H0_9BACT
MLSIVAAAAHVPERIAFHGVQAQERNLGYAHLLFRSASFARPRGRGRMTEEEGARLATRAPATLPVARRAKSVSDLATGAAKALREKVGHAVMAKTTHILVAHGALNQQIAESLPGRVQFELGIKDALPLGVSQLGTLGIYAAWPLLDGLLRRAEDQALLIAADKWIYPFFRSFGDCVSFGDGAAAVLVRRGDAVRGFALEHGAAIDDPWSRTPSQLRAALLPLAVAAGRRALLHAGIERGQLDSIVAPGHEQGFTDAVADALEIRAEQRHRRREPGHMSSADSLVAFLEYQSTLPAGSRRTVLLWDAALCGAAGAMVVDIQGEVP